MHAESCKKNDGHGGGGREPWNKSDDVEGSREPRSLTCKGVYDMVSRGVVVMYGDIRQQEKQMWVKKTDVDAARSTCRAAEAG